MFIVASRRHEFQKKKPKKTTKKAEKKGKKKAHFSGLKSSFVKVFDNKKFDSMSEQRKGWQTLELRRFKLKKNTKIIIAKPEGLDLYKAVHSPIFAFIFLFLIHREILVNKTLNRRYNCRDCYNDKTKGELLVQV